MRAISSILWEGDKNPIPLLIAQRDSRFFENASTHRLSHADEENGWYPDPCSSCLGDPHTDSGMYLDRLPHTWPPACSSSAGHVAAISRAPGSLTQSTKNDNLVPHDPGNPPFRKRCSLGYQPGSSRSRQRRGLAFLRWGCGQH